MYRSCLIASGVALTLTACGEDVLQTTPNQAPIIGEVQISPRPATVLTPILCTPIDVSDPDDDPVTVEYSWLVNDQALADQATNQLQPGVVVRDEYVVCEVVPFDGEEQGEPVRSMAAAIINVAPTAPVVAIAPQPATENDELTCLVTQASTDAESDAVTYRYQWFNDDVLQAALTTEIVPASATSGEEQWMCTVTPYDGRDFGPSASDTVTIDAVAIDPSGSFAIAPAVSYSCSSGLVGLSYSQFTFNDDGTTLTVNPPLMNGGCAMTGASAADGSFDVTCTYSGTCDETYSLVGSFSDNDSWSGTLSAAYSGLCLDCSLQQWSITGSRL